ncbi:MAG TPA: methionine synthase [Candidatus Wallbacteria bacterium]|nr:methionine synthase [Candidatus Wallbacteria bacterium]
MFFIYVDGFAVGKRCLSISKSFVNGVSMTVNTKKINKNKVERLINYCLKTPLLFDGAMGTQIQAQCPDQALFCGYEGFGEQLNLTAPHLIENIHLNYLRSGACGIETNTFSANGIVMGEYGIGEDSKVYEIARRGAEIGAGAARSFAVKNPGEYFVGGSIGPSTKLPGLGHIGFKEMAAAYRPQVEGLMDGGADILLVETCQDILQVKCLLYVIGEVFAVKGEALPVMVSLTLQQNGAMLVGTDIAAIAAILNDYEIVTSIGFNCALGPFELEKHVETLCRATNKLVSAMPNAGLPENVHGKTVYRLTPDEYAGFISRFVSKYGVNIAGGCCGTTPAHIEKAAAVLAGVKPAARLNEIEPSVSSVYNAWSKKQEPRPFIIGERANANGSKAFRELLLKQDYDAMLAVAKNQQNGGAHALDLCVAYVGRDEIKDMNEVSKRFASAVNLPLVIDSTSPEVIETALMNHGGKCIINSINLEDGGGKLRIVSAMAKKFNASLIALTIDEEGMAKTVEKKLAVAKRIYDICVNEFLVAPHDLIFDPLTFTIGSGDDTLRDSAMETIEAIKMIKGALPGVNTSLGISNVSFGLKPKIREIINSVFLKHCIEAGLDMAIINPAGFLAYHRIEKDDLGMVENLIFNRRNGENDPLLDMLKYFDKKMSEGAYGPDAPDAAQNLKLSPAEKLSKMVIDGDRKGLEEAVEKLSAEMKPLEIINGPLIDAMKKVGELFGAGIMQLPFVLQSAEVMKRAVGILEAKMEKASYEKAGKMVLATVAGDVHDIGKNLVDIILTNNGFEVYNIGIKIPVEEMIVACEKNGANVMGMSGLLVRSTEVMRENLLELERRGKRYDVVLGGAALTRRFVEEDLAKLYGGRVFYAEDAFSGLMILKNICSGGPAAGGGSVKRSSAKPVNAIAGIKINAAACEPRVSSPADIPAVPFLGRRVIKNIDPAEVYPFINKTTLFRGQWQYRRGNMQKNEYDRLIAETVEPLFTRLTQKCRAEGLFELGAVYGYYKCVSAGETVRIFDPEDENKILAEFGFPRQKVKNGLSIADFISPESSGVKDVMGLLAVTAGKKAGAEIKKLYSGDNYKDYLHLHGLSVEMAEALTEYMHLLIRKEMGIIDENALDNQAIVRQKYRGSRYSFGYPACPDLAMQKELFNILDPGEIDVELTESFEMTPEQSTTAIIIHHPDAKYFAV